MIKKTLFTDWNFMRVLRLGIGIAVAIHAVENQSMISGVFAVFLLFQAITNTGCCGSNSCAVTMKKNNLDKTEAIEYKEVK